MRLVRCSDNENIAMYLWTKREVVVECGAISDNHDMTISNAYRNICSSKTPIKTIKDLSQIKGVGKWILRLMHGFFLDDPPSGASPTKLSTKSKQHYLSSKLFAGKKVKGLKRYVPQKNSVAYALLITFYRGIADGVEFMKKQELIDAAEASGLSRNSISWSLCGILPTQLAECRDAEHHFRDMMRSSCCSGNEHLRPA